MPTTIYALCEPDLQVPVIRYIGKTVNAAKRLKGHLSESHKKRTHLGCWLRSLKACGERPIWMTLTEVPDEIGPAAEILYIRLAREGGMDLVNATEGGEGSSGPKSPKTCAAISAAKKGVPTSPEHCAALSVALMGVPKSPEHCAAISAARTGVSQGPHSSEHCAAISAAMREAWILRKMPKFSGGGGI